MTDPGVTQIVALSTQHLTAETAEDDGELLLWIEDGATAVELVHEVGDPEAAAQALDRLAVKVREHAERIRYRHRMHTTGWT